MKMKPKGLNLLLAFALLLAMLAAGVRLAAADGQAGTTLSAEVCAEGHLTRTFHWTIDKSVAPDAWHLFRGDSGTSQYTITVTKDEGTLAAWIDGEVCVTNGGAVATENLAIVVELRNGTPPPNDLIATVVVDVSGNPVLDPGETGCYAYHIDIPAEAIHPGGTYKVTAKVTITNHSGHLGEPFGPSPSDTTLLPVTPTLINDSIHVDDTNGGSWEFSASGSVTYTKTFECGEDEGLHRNTATIRETGQKGSASVDVSCYALKVKKDAQTSFKRTYEWHITKFADQSSLTLALHQTFAVNYSVRVNAGYEDSDWAVSGHIWVKNPAPIAARINAVSDVVSDVGAAAVDCGVSFPYTLAAGGTLTCTYTRALPNASTRTNTATVTLQNYDYDKDGHGTANGATDFSASAEVNFAEAEITHIDECIDVSDTYAGSLGRVCYGDPLPHTFTYTRDIGPYEVCGDYTVKNTASFVTNDRHLSGSDSWTVYVHVPCPGCTLTIGYWKTHAGFGPQADMVTPLLPQWLGTAGGSKSIQVTSAAQAVQFLSFRGSNNVFNASNGINKLYAQLLGAKLNIANGADGSVVSAIIAAADAFLANHNSTDWNSLSKAQRNLVLLWASALDDYNNGLIGPGHCSQ